MRMREKAINAESLLCLRLGELALQLGRYDMYGLALLDALCGEVNESVRRLQPTVENRGRMIRVLMEGLSISVEVQTEYREIDEAVQEILRKHVIGALHPAVLSVTPMARQYPSMPGPGRSGRNQSATGCLSSQIESIERDIIRVVRLSLKVACVVECIQAKTLGKVTDGLQLYPDHCH